MRTIQFEDLATSTLTQLISRKESFEVIGLRGNFMASVRTMEKKIEAQGLKCRVSSDMKGTMAQAGAVGVLAGAISLSTLPLVALTAAGIAAHKLVTYDPDYEIVKDYVNMKITVKYAK
mgnify:CR=1 FL=1